VLSAGESILRLTHIPDVLLERPFFLLVWRRQEPMLLVQICVAGTMTMTRRQRASADRQSGTSLLWCDPAGDYIEGNNPARIYLRARKMEESTGAMQERKLSAVA
jgi:hypothetical protein